MDWDSNPIAAKGMPSVVKIDFGISRRQVINGSTDLANAQVARETDQHRRVIDSERRRGSEPLHHALTACRAASSRSGAELIVATTSPVSTSGKGMVACLMSPVRKVTDPLTSSPAEPTSPSPMAAWRSPSASSAPGTLTGRKRVARAGSAYSRGCLRAPPAPPIDGALARGSADRPDHRGQRQAEPNPKSIA